MTTTEDILKDIVNSLNLAAFSHKGRFFYTIDEAIIEAKNEKIIHIELFWRHPALKQDRYIILKQQSVTYSTSKDYENFKNAQISRFITLFYKYSVFAKKSDSYRSIPNIPMVVVPVQELALQEDESVKFINDAINTYSLPEPYYQTL